MEGMSIGEVARKAGVRPSALRFYEGVGVLPAPVRVNGRRRYGEEVLELLAFVRVAQQAGFTVTDIRTLLHGFPEEISLSARWRALAGEKLPEIEARIQAALGMKRLLEDGTNCDCSSLKDCRAIASR